MLITEMDNSILNPVSRRNSLNKGSKAFYGCGQFTVTVNTKCNFDLNR